MVVCVIDHAELAWSDTVDGGCGVDDVFAWGFRRLNLGRQELRGVANLDGNVERCDLLEGEGQMVEIADAEVLAVGSLGVVTVGDVDNVLLDVFHDDEPGASAQSHAFALADGVEPMAFVVADDATCLQFYDVAWQFAKVTAQIVVIVYFAEEADAL